MARNKSTAKQNMLKKRDEALAGKDLKKDEATPTDAGKKRRWRPGTQAIREIKRLQRSTKTVVPRAAMARAIRGMVENKEIRWSPLALNTIHACAEEFVTTFLRKAQLVACSNNRTTLSKRDLDTVRALQQQQ